MRNFFITSAVLLSMNLAYAFHPISLAGLYDCNGSEVGSNEPFTCLLKIQKTNQTYEVKSTCNDNSSYIGTGIYDAKRHILSLAFVNPNKIEETGVSISEVKKDYTINSTWTYLHKTTIAQSFCVKRVKQLQIIQFRH